LEIDVVNIFEIIVGNGFGEFELKLELLTFLKVELEIDVANHLEIEGVSQFCKPFEKL
jgi:hypothetical protein